MKIGVGVKNKVLESISMEVPIICSSISCDGISKNIHKFLNIVKDEKELIKKIIEISHNYSFFNKNSSFAKDLLKYDHDWNTISKKYLDS